MSLATKYRPKTWEDVTEQSTIINILSKICEQEDLENRNFLFIGPAGTGKAELLTNRILTTSGFKMMKDLQIGDEVFTGSGNRGRIVGLYPQGKRPIYRITLQDRTHIDVSDEHINVFYRYNEDKKRREDFCMTTTDMLKFFQTSRFKLRIDIPKVDWEDHEVPVDPYLLGALIGDGSFSSGNCGFSNSESDVVEKVDKLLRETLSCFLDKLPGDNVDYNIKKLNVSKNKYLYSFLDKEYLSQSDLIDALVDAGYPHMDPSTIHNILNGGNSSRAKQYPELASSIKILKDNSAQFQQPHPVVDAFSKLNLLVPSIKKHIPKCYLYNSIDVRKRLLQGLIDTDGYTDAQGLVSFTTSSPQLSEDFAFLVRSLGIRDTVVVSPSSYVNPTGSKIQCQDSYTHNLKIHNDFKDYATSIKHTSRWTKKQNPPIRNIVSIEYIGEDECQCIMIDHPDHTYISSEGFIPTHNTTTARIMANVLNGGNDNSTIEIDAASHNGVDSVREIVNQARMYPVGAKWKVFVIDECFPGNTNIAIPSGKKAIQDIQIGDEVVSKEGIRKVTNTFINHVPTSRLICLHITNAVKIITTLDHKFYSNDEWVEAQNLRPSDPLVFLDSYFPNYFKPISEPRLVFSEIYTPGKNDEVFNPYVPQEELDSGWTDLYDLEVEEEHCYYANGVLVHNCHSFSQQAWQIFLKPLEDAPAKTIFIFCTTNPEKIPATILSRVQTFQLSKISLKGIYNRLIHIIGEENREEAGITYTEEAVNYIAKLANGGMRDSITTLDKALAFTHDLTSESVAQALGLPEYDDYFKLLGAYSKKDNRTVSEVINNVYNSGVNFVKWFEGFHSFVMNVVKYIFLQDINLTMIPSHYQQKIANYGSAHSVVCLKLANKLLKLNYELKTTQYLQEVALTYLCQVPVKKEGQ